MVCLLFSQAKITFAAVPVEAHPTIVVMDFSTHPGASSRRVDLGGVSRAVCDYIITRLVADGRFLVVERDLLQERFAEEGISVEGIIAPETARRIGTMLNAQYILYGDVTDVSDSRTGTRTDTYIGDVSIGTIKAHIVARLMNAQTGELVMAAKGEGKSKSALVKVNADEHNSLIVGTKKISQDSVVSALQKAAENTVDLLLIRLYGEDGKKEK